MQEKQATGLDTKAMLPIFGCIFMGIAEIFFPWFSMPVLKYYNRPTEYKLSDLRVALGYFQKSLEQGQKLNMEPLTFAEMKQADQWIRIIQLSAAVSVFLLVCAAVVCYIRKEKSVIFLRISLLWTIGTSAVVFAAFYMGNVFLNQKLGREISFINFTLHSYLKLTVYPYAQFIVSALIFITARKFLDIKADNQTKITNLRTKKTDKNIGKRTKAAALLIFLGIPLCIFFGIFFLDNKSNSFIALCIIGLSMLPFFMIFEDRKPQARELLLIAVMASIAVAGRVAFFMVPQFKPVSAIVIITGVGLGAEAGFLTGAIAGFVSNFFFGQGPWTPWQMAAFGIIGFLAGVIFRGIGKKYAENRAALCIYGGFATMVIYGLMMDTSSVMFMIGDFKWKALLATYISGFPFNVIHGISTAVFLFFMANPMSQKLKRIKKKYGILEV